MKKRIATMVLLLLCASLAACGEKEETPVTGGWTLTAEAEAHTLRLTAAKGDWAMTLSACDTFTLHSLWPQTAAKAYLLGDRIAAEETEDCLTLHTSPYDPLQP